MPEYHPPLAGRHALRLDFNENTFAPSPRVLAKLQQLTAEGLTVYPEREPVERILAQYLGVESNQVILTNGVDEAIHLMACAFLDEGDEALICTPTFFMYDVSVGMMTSGLIKVQTADSLEFPFERFLASITPRTKLIVIASPNNPTGATVSREHLLAIAAAAPQAVLMVDEAYFHFFGDTVLPDIANVPNLIVARTFSKAYGLARSAHRRAVRKRKAHRLSSKVSSPYNVNGVALAILPEALADTEYLNWYVTQVHQGRERIFAVLRELNVRTWPSAANFVLMDIGPRHKELCTRMRERGVLLRDRSADPGCDGYVRITVGVEEHVTRGIEALRAVLGEMKWTPAESRRPVTTSTEEREFE